MELQRLYEDLHQLAQAANQMSLFNESIKIHQFGLALYGDNHEYPLTGLCNAYLLGSMYSEIIGAIKTAFPTHEEIPINFKYYLMVAHYKLDNQPAAISLASELSAISAGTEVEKGIVDASIELRRELNA